MRKQVVATAPRSSQLVLGGVSVAGGDNCFSRGTFLSLYRILELESQEPITHRPMQLGVQ